MASTTLIVASLVTAAGGAIVADAQPPVPSSAPLDLSPRTADLGGWTTVSAGSDSSARFDAGRRAGAASLRLADDAGSGFAAITAALPSRSRVTIRTRINIYRMRLDGGASRPLAWVGNTSGQSQQAGVINVGGALRWATWYVTASGRRTDVSIGRTTVVSRRWQRMELTTAWSSRQARTTLTVGGRVVVLSRALDMRGIRANRASVGIGRASRAGQKATVLLRSAAVRFGLRGAGKPPEAAAPSLAPPSPTMLSPEVHPYSPGFAFNEAIPEGIPSDPRSAAVVGRFAQNVATSKVALSSKGEVPPVYIAAPGDPLFSVSVGGVRTRFRVPVAAQVGGGSDHPLVILDPNSPIHGRHTELRLWQASIGSGTLSASGAGLFHYNSDGAALNPDGSQSLGTPFAGSGTGSGLSILAGLIRGEEVRAGQIRHALRFAYSAADFSNRHRAPATRSDQPNGTSTRDAASAMDMGMRLQLDPAVDCDARTVPGRSATGPETRFLRMVCHALQDYGMIAVDGTVTGGILLMAEGGATADWGVITGNEVNGSYAYVLRDATTPSDGLSRDGSSGIPWSRMRVLARSDF